MTVQPWLGDAATPYVGPDLFTGPESTSATPVVSASLQEAVGVAQDTVTIGQYVHLMNADIHSPQFALGYALNPLGPGEGTTYERWVRVRFDPPFNSIFGIRFFTLNYTPLPGWTVNWGHAPTYATPVNTASAIATTPVPTTDPGSTAPNLGTLDRLPGTGVQYTDWIVLQAVVDLGTVGYGTPQGFTAEGSLITIEYHVNWIED